MPDRSYAPINGKPPTGWDHFLAHPGETSIAIWWIIIGSVMVAQVAIDGFEASRSLTTLPTGLGSAVATAITLGGALATTGLFWSGKASTEWLLERLGWIVGATGWASWGVAVLSTFPGSVVTITLSGAMLTVAAGRLLALRQVEKDIRTRAATIDKGDTV